MTGGWLGPGLTGTLETPDLLAEEGRAIHIRLGPDGVPAEKPTRFIRSRPLVLRIAWFGPEPHKRRSMPRIFPG